MPKTAPSEDQLQNYKATVKKQNFITTSNGAPIENKTTVLTVGPRGPLLMQDVVFMDEMAHFDRERIPERVVHAKACGAHGYLEVIHDITKYCKADLFKEVGMKTPVMARISTVGGELGSADTARDPRGFAIKFYTEEGNWDLVGLNSPIFFIRDPIFFPSFIHSQKRNPRTNLKDPSMMWDFWSLRPEGTHAIMFLFSDRGTPDGVRHINGYGCHTFKMVNKEGEAFYCKFHFKPEEGIKNLSSEEAVRLQGTDPDYATRDLYDSIEEGNFPAWKMMIQVMPFDQADKADFNPFDVTKVWPHKDYPLIPVGRLVLDRNPKDYFAEVEQAAFSPSHVVPGIEFSPDRMLQGRLFSYPDAQFHRLGPNYVQLPINCPYRAKAHNTQRAGWCTYESQADAPNYFPNSFGGPEERADVAEHKHTIQGEVWRHDSKDDDNFSQAAEFWNKVLDQPARERLVQNISDSLKKAKPFIQDRVIGNCSKVSSEMGEMLRNKIDQA